MIFSDQSDVTIVITSCGRFDLLKRTLSSLDLLNTEPIRSVIITEDSGREEVHGCIPDGWREFVKVIVNKEKVGQIGSVDMAYGLVETKWIFHCEDDWLFCRPGFIEDSKLVMESEPGALQVWLRSYYHDLAVHSPNILLGRRSVVDNVAYNRVVSENPDWGVFSFNPGLRRIEDYLLHSPYSDVGGEKALSKLYGSEGRFSLILENDAVLHTGWERHVESRKEKRKNQKRYFIYTLFGFVCFSVGFRAGMWAI